MGSVSVTSSPTSLALRLTASDRPRIIQPLRCPTSPGFAKLGAVRGLRGEAGTAPAHAVPTLCSEIAALSTGTFYRTCEPSECPGSLCVSCYNEPLLMPEPKMQFPPYGARDDNLLGKLFIW